MRPRTIDELVIDRPDYAAWALRYPGFLALLSDDQLAPLVVLFPFFALHYARSRLTAGQFADCVKAEPNMRFAKYGTC